MGTFKIGIIGAGGIAGAHAAAAKASEGAVTIAAVADPTEAARTKLAGEWNAKPFASAHDLIAAAKSLDLGGVVVCTPPHVRVAIVKASLDAGLPVLSEKPIASSLADAHVLADLTRSNPKARTAVAYCHRFTPAVLEMRRLIAAGKVGRVTRWENVFACDLPGHSGKWFSDLSVSGGGAFIDMGSHSVDLFRFMMGEAALVGAVYDHAWSGRAESGATVLLKNSVPHGNNIGTGTAGFIASGWAETSRFTVAVLGTAGMLFYDYEKPEEIVFKDLVGKAESISIQEHGVRFARQLKQFAAFATGGESGGLATFEDGLATARIVDAANRAGR
jgi:predicted dehydrogenase